MERDDELQLAIDEAAERVAHLPPELQGPAFREVFRVLHNPAAEVRTNTRVEPMSGLDETSVIPTPAAVAARGNRLHKLLFAAYQLEKAGEPATTAAISAYLTQRLATKIKGTGAFDVLKENTPRYFERRKDGAKYTYSPTADGVAFLASLATTDADAK